MVPSARILYAVVAVTLLSAAPLLAQPRLTMAWEAMAEQLVRRLAPAPSPLALTGFGLGLGFGGGDLGF